MGQVLPAPGTVDGLGVNIHFTDERPGELAMLAAAGIRWVRMDLVWSATERERGVYDFSGYARLLNGLDAHGLRALFILDYSNRLYEQDRSVATPEGRAAYARWAAAAAERFAGRGIVWEIWNEPNLANFWRPEPDVDLYAAMAREAVAAIRAAAPGEGVVGPAASGFDWAFLEGCFRAGLLEDWDAVSVHPYRRSGPETVLGDYARLRRLIDRYAPPGKTIPIVSGEWGYSAAWSGFNPDRQGRLLARQWLVNLSRGIPLSIWYDWHDDGADPEEPEHHFGTVAFPYHDGRSPPYDAKPAYRAARALAKALDGFRFDRRLAVGGPDDFILLFARGDRQRLAVWTAGESAHTVSMPSAECAFSVVGHLGDPGSPLAAGDGSVALPLRGAPLYLTPDRPNPALARIPSRPALAVTVEPGPGHGWIVRMNNLDPHPFRGSLVPPPSAITNGQPAAIAVALGPDQTGWSTRILGGLQTDGPAVISITDAEGREVLQARLPRVRVRDGAGTTWQPTGEAIQGSGWRFVTMPFNAQTAHWGGQDGQEPPLTWDSLFLLDNPSRRARSGRIFVAGPVVVP